MSGGSVTPPTDRVRLRGPSRAIDRRVHAVRDDLADVALAGTVFSPRFAAALERQCAVPGVMLRTDPDGAARAVSELLYGEGFAVFDRVPGWVWGQCAVDGYVGWVPSVALGPPVPATHRVSVGAATVFAAPDIKAAVTGYLPLNARLAAAPAGEAFVAAAGGYVHRRHVAPVATPAGEALALAQAFVGTPYVWGGRTRDGIDCSGLVQAVALACDVACPRDSDQQAATFPETDAADRRRGDVAIFAGHIGILLDRDTILHATAFAMAVVVEPLAAVAARATACGFRRLPWPLVTPCSGD